MNTLEFLEAVLPPTGVYYLALIDKATGRVAHKHYTNLQEMADGVLSYDDSGKYNVYHACSSYKEPMMIGDDGKKKFRTNLNWDRAKALWIDLDCGEEKAQKGEGYLTKKDAATAITKFCTENNFPKPMFVDSGNGVHCYWPFTKAIKADAWVKLANVFKYVLAHYGVLADPTCTADFARILRPVGSNNRKKEVKPVVGKKMIDPIDPAVISSVLSTLVKANEIKVSSVSKAPVADINDDLTAHLPPSIPSYAQEIANHCNQFKVVRDTQGDVSYEHWRHVIGTTSLCVDGLDIAYKWSARRADTGHSQTDVKVKFDSWNAGPSLCKTFESINPKGCNGCPHKAEIITPLVLGRSSYVNSINVENNEELQQSPLFFPDKNGKGIPRGTTANVDAVLKHEGVTTRYNQMAKVVEVIVPNVISVADEFNNSNLTAAKDLLVTHGVPIGRALEQIYSIASSNPYCPVIKMIESKPWDGISRFEQFLSQIKTKHPKEARLYSRKWLVQAVGAVYVKDGLSAAGILVLTGPQNLGKTSLIRQLASTVPKGFLESAILDPSNKDSVMTTVSHWIVELGELDATFRKSDLAQLKAFITKNKDKLRKPYGISDSEFPRRTVMAGTVNDHQFLRDTTGNRRFWVIEADDIQIDHSIDIQQLWAEVKTWYDSGEKWYFDKTELEALNIQNSEYEVDDPIVEKIRIKFDFEDMKKTSWLTATRIAELIGIDQPTKPDINRVSSCVRNLNGNQSKRSNGLRLLQVPGEHK